MKAAHQKLEKRLLQLSIHLGIRFPHSVWWLILPLLFEDTFTGAKMKFTKRVSDEFLSEIIGYVKKSILNRCIASIWITSKGLVIDISVLVHSGYIVHSK